MWSREVRAARLLRRDEIHELDPHLVWIEDNSADTCHLVPSARALRRAASSRSVAAPRRAPGGPTIRVSASAAAPPLGARASSRSTAPSATTRRIGGTTSLSGAVLQSGAAAPRAPRPRRVATPGRRGATPEEQTGSNGRLWGDRRAAPRVVPVRASAALGDRASHQRRLPLHGLAR